MHITAAGCQQSIVDPILSNSSLLYKMSGMTAMTTTEDDTLSNCLGFSPPIMSYWECVVEVSIIAVPSVILIVLLAVVCCCCCCCCLKRKRKRQQHNRDHEKGEEISLNERKTSSEQTNENIKNGQTAVADESSSDQPQQSTNRDVVNPEEPAYQDPQTIVRQIAPTGDIYTMPQVKKKGKSVDGDESPRTDSYHGALEPSTDRPPEIPPKQYVEELEQKEQELQANNSQKLSRKAYVNYTEVEFDNSANGPETVDHEQTDHEQIDNVEYAEINI